MLDGAWQQQAALQAWLQLALASALLVPDALLCAALASAGSASAQFMSAATAAVCSVVI